jgi:hypothetical protein
MVPDLLVLAVTIKAVVTWTRVDQAKRTGQVIDTD